MKVLPSHRRGYSSEAYHRLMEENERYRVALVKIAESKLEDIPGDKCDDEFHKTLMASAAWMRCMWIATAALKGKPQ